MREYGVRDVERLLRLPRSTILRLVQAGFVSPGRGTRREYRFSFQDLIVLRTAQALAAAKVPPKRITQSLKALRRKLPATVPLSGLNISAVGERVVVKEGGARWRADSGQYLLALEVDPADGSINVADPVEAAAPRAEEWFDKGLRLENGNLRAARDAYERALAVDPAHLDAHINLGRLLHESGRLTDAERAYRRALQACGADPVLLYNLGVLLEDMGRKEEAVEAYERTLHRNPQMADCHYNLALLCEELGRPKHAIRHMAQYRRLLGTKPD
ncbi:MAG: tetratricopeptide repeat protein [Burkholderiales bacterium]